MKHTFANKCLSLFMVALITLLPISTAGCGTSELRQSIQTAEAVAQSAGNILSASNPEAGSLLLQAGGALKELDLLIGQYDSAVAAGKPGIAAQIQAITGVLTANLADILNTVRVKNPELVEYITVAVAIANSVVMIVLQHLPAAGVNAQAQAVAVAQAQALPTIPFKSHKDLKAAWDNKVAGAYPKAKI